MKFNFVIYLFLGLILGPLSLSANAEVFKWKDSSGKVVYSDTPPVQKKVSKLHIDPIASSPSAVIQKAKPDNIKATNLNKEIEQTNAHAATYNAKMKIANCKAMQDNLKRLTNSEGHRILSKNNKGEVGYLSEKDKSDMLQLTKEGVNHWCK